MALTRKFRSDDSGQIATIFALAVLPVVIGVGAAIDYSRANNGRSSLQAALDSAVLAAAIDASANWNQVATNTYNGNVNAKGGVPGTATFTLESGGIYSGVAASTTPTAFMGIIGIRSMPIQVRAKAITTKVPVCLLGLNAFDKGAFDMNGNAKLNAATCAVQANTTDGKGMTQEGNPTAIAQYFGVAGAHTGTGYSTTPKDGAGQVADPYASIPFPAYSACGNNPKGMDINGGTTVLDPGTYCGGIRIKGGASVTLNAGIYVMVDGAFQVDGASTVTGTEVTIAFTGDDATLRLWGNSTLNLTSPTSGTYTNFQFFQNPNDDKGRGAWVSIGGNGNNGGDGSKATWDGVAYFPTQNFWVYGNPVVNVNSPSLAIVAGQIWDQGNATINVTNLNKRNLKVTQTMTSGGARLLQ
jgi:hypothetical protein